MFSTVSGHWKIHISIIVGWTVNLNDLQSFSFICVKLNSILSNFTHSIYLTCPAEENDINMKTRPKTLNNNYIVGMGGDFISENTENLHKHSY